MSFGKVCRGGGARTSSHQEDPDTHAGSWVRRDQLGRSGQPASTNWPFSRILIGAAVPSTGNKWIISPDLIRAPMNRRRVEVDDAEDDLDQRVTRRGGRVSECRGGVPERREPGARRPAQPGHLRGAAEGRAPGHRRQRGRLRPAVVRAAARPGCRDPVMGTVGAAGDRNRDDRLAFGTAVTGANALSGAAAKGSRKNKTLI
jgi:hypothetical protein